MKHFIITTSLIAAVTFGSGCSQWLDVQPYDQISEEQLFSSEEGFQKLLNGIYIELCSTELYGASLGPEMIEVMGGAYEIGDDAVKWSNYPDLKRYNYASDYWRDRLDATWNKAYSLILNCNKLLEGLEGREELFTTGHAAIIRGEALALRAMLHFDLLRLFGPVYSQQPEALSIPYYTSRTTTPEPQLAASEVISRILADLTRARTELAGDPVITEGTLMSADPSGGSSFLRYRALRLNYYAVTALEARVQLYAGNRTEAFNRALEVIRAADKGIFPFVERAAVVGTEDPDRIFSTEVLFALSHSSRNQIFLDYFSPSRTTFVFKMESALINQVIYGGGQTTGGYQDDYRNRVGWSTSGSNRYLQIRRHGEQRGDRKHDDPDVAAGRDVPHRSRGPVGQSEQRHLVRQHAAPQPGNQHLAAESHAGAAHL